MLKRKITHFFGAGKLKVPLIVLAFLFVCSTAFGLKLPKLFSFNRWNALDEWMEKVFKGKVIYTVNLAYSGGYLTAHSDRAASGIFYRLSFHPKSKPMASWKWKVIKFPDKRKSKISAKGWVEKDDYAARFYIIFPGFLFSGTKCLEYVWDENLAEEAILTSPYFENIKIIVAESGDKNLSKWVYEERNIPEDYRRAFGREPGRVGAVAIMTDADNTLSTAEAWYDEIRVGYRDDEK